MRNVMMCGLMIAVSGCGPKYPAPEPRETIVIDAAPEDANDMPGYVLNRAHFPHKPMETLPGANAETASEGQESAVKENGDGNSPPSFSTLSTPERLEYIAKTEALLEGGAHEAMARPDFEIVSFTPKWRYGSLYAIGEIRNNSKIAGGPHVEVIARDKNGVLVASKDFWPNSTINIPPGGTCGVDHAITEDPTATTLEIKVISIDRW